MTAEQLFEAFGIKFSPNRTQPHALEVMLSAYPQNLREQHDQALNWLFKTLDEGGPPGTGWPFTKESWSTIYSRRMSNKYTAPQMLARKIWISRHVHVRHLAHNESFAASTEHIASVWKHKKASSIRSAAHQDKVKAMDWIQISIEAIRAHPIQGAPIHSDTEIYGALDRAIERDIIPAYLKRGRSRKSHGVKRR